MCCGLIEKTTFNINKCKIGFLFTIHVLSTVLLSVYNIDKIKSTYARGFFVHWINGKRLFLSSTKLTASVLLDCVQNLLVVIGAMLEF